MSNDTSVCLSIYNQQSIIDKVINGIVSNASPDVKELIILFDGCYDNTEKIVKEILNNSKIKTRYYWSDNVNEVKANNITFRQAICPYIISVQDDMVITEPDFDRRLRKPFACLSNLLGVTARNAQDERIEDGTIKCFNVAGKDVNSPRVLFAVRDVIVRGAIMFNHEIVKSLNYLDEDFAPLDSDDKDLSFRAYRKGYFVGAYMMDYYSPLEWGKTRTDVNSNITWQKSVKKNVKLIIERHSDLLNAEKHDMNILLE